MSGELGGPSIDDIQDRELVQLQIHVMIGLFGTAAIIRAEPKDFWEWEVQEMGPNLGDMGIPDVPTKPGWYLWYGTVKFIEPDDVEYRGEWVQMVGLKE